MMNQSNHTNDMLDSAMSVDEILEMLCKYNKQSSRTPISRLISDEGRFESFSCGIEGILLDFSRTRLDENSLKLLLALADKRGLKAARDRLFSGEHVNTTENRPAMHMALRSRTLGTGLPETEFDAMEQGMEKMLDFAGSLHLGRLPGDPQASIRNIIHVGIGGSLLGTRLLCDVFDHGGDAAPDVHFLGSVDAHLREKLLPGLKPEETVVVLVSKSFTTADTLMHGHRIHDWLAERMGPEAASLRMFAVTGEHERAVSAGIPGNQVMHLPDWVGGRYSLWSPVSLAAAAMASPQVFRELARGAAELDQHFLESDLHANLPVLMGLLGFWHRNICGYSSWGVIPYDQRLRLLPSHLQQLIMESTGKSVTDQGRPATLATAPVVFGECGTDAQHSLFQAMHQGSDRVPLNMVAVIRPDHEDQEAQQELLANLLAQVTALAMGRTAEQTRHELESGGMTVSEEMVAHRTFEGNRPTELLLLDDLGPANLGKLLALYEHKVFVESVMWGVYAFDQWGVELGKSLAPQIRRSLSEGETETGTDTDTNTDTNTPGLNGLLEYILQRS
jgi:glucose-6-phosphate isomerase